jgi:hypothetical protein
LIGRARRSSDAGCESHGHAASWAEFWGWGLRIRPAVSAIEGRGFGDRQRAPGTLESSDPDLDTTRKPARRTGSVPMELAGLEPATSWVRFRSAPSLNPLHKRVSGPVQRCRTPRIPRACPGVLGMERAPSPKTAGALSSEPSQRSSGAEASGSRACLPTGTRRGWPRPLPADGSD